ncbi:MAG TPA: PIN domain-containing protein [Chloroflexia bacterium]|nr:PIN domain-containing protein [Chloroflexia bacterium]
MRVLLDTNVVLDVLLVRAPFVETSSQVWQRVDDGSIEGYVLASAVTDIFYLARKQVGLKTAHKAIRTCLNAFEICTIDRPMLDRALMLSGSDLEDNLQEACALIYGLDAIVTRDKEGFKSSNIPTLTPAELLSQLASTS